MKKLELKQRENLEGGKSSYCTKEATGLLLGAGCFVFAAATGGIGALAVAGLSFYLAADSAAGGACSSW